MLCNKCNSPVPDGAKFCPNCGALTAPAAEKKFCENCGLELPKGAKFCTVCGAAVTKKASAEVKPSDVLAPVTPSEPVSIAPAVDLAKTSAMSENTVAAVTVNTESAFSIPIPTSDISMPSVGAAPVEEPAAVIPEPVSVPTSFEESDLGFIPEAPVITETPVIPEPTGYSAAAASYAAPTAAPAPAPTAAPAYTASPNNQPENPFGDYGASAAAVAAKPIKKKSVLKPILIAVCSLIGAVLIAAGVLFFVNKSLLFNIVLGNSGYAAMVEGNSIKDVTNKLDVSAMSQGIKSATGSMAGALTQLSNKTSGITTTGVTPMMSSSMSNIGSVDFKTLVNQLGNIMRETYGANSAKISMNFSAELTDTALAQLTSSLKCTKKEIEDVLKLINESSFSVDVAADGKALESAVEISGGSLKLNAKTVITEDGNVYLVLPFVSEKAFMLKIGTGYTASAGQVSDIYLEIEEKELKRIIDKLVSIYVDVYKSSQITVQDGEISIAGATAKGKYITATLTGSKITEMMKKTGDALADDSYLCGKLAKFLSDCGLPVSAEQIKSTFQSMFSMVAIPDSSFALTIETVTDNSLRVLAKSYSVSINGKSTKIAVVGDFNTSTKNGNTAAASVEINGQTIASALFEKSSDTDGVCTVTVYNNNTSVSAKVKYSGVKETTFNGKPTFEGDFEISMVLPADFTQAGNSEAAAVISSAKIAFSVKVENGNTLKETVSFEIPQYGKLSANATLTTEDKQGGISIPSDVIDITDAATANPDEIPESLKKDVISYLKDLKNAIKNQNAGELGNKLASSLGDLIDLAENGPTADTYEIGDLMVAISNDKSEIMMFDEQYGNEIEKFSNKSRMLVQKYEALETAIADKNFKMTEKEFEAFQNTFATLTAEKDALQKEYEEEYNPQTPSIDYTSKAESIDFTSLDFKSLTLILLEYEARYNSVLEQYSDLFKRDAEINALVGETNTKYETALEDFDNLYDVYQAGSLNLSLLRKSRKSTQAFALSVEALEKAAASTI